jgi:bacterioferritin (cytochrome b1)
MNQCILGNLTEDTKALEKFRERFAVVAKDMDYFADHLFDRWYHGFEENKISINTRNSL